MFGVRFIKVQPTTYLLQYKNGQLKRQGLGLAFYYYAPTTSLVAVPVASNDAPFMFSETTADFQEISLQGQVTYRVVDPAKVSALLNFTLDPVTYRHLSDDPEKLPERVVNLVRVLARKQIETLPMRQALRASDRIVTNLRTDLAASPEILALGLEIIGLSILAIKPTPESARALEAAAREALLKESDDALYGRRNSSIEQERAIKENELATELAVELKKRQIRDAEIDTERSVLEKRITLEGRNKDLIAVSGGNQRAEADVRAYGVAAMMRALADTDKGTIQALASIGMKPDQLIAIAFREMAERADKIGQLNLSPDLLREMMAQDGTVSRTPPAPAAARK